MSLIEIPERLKARPRHRGLPVPFIAIELPGKPPQFGANDGHLLELAMEDRLCALCGQQLEYWMAFIGTHGECYKTRIFAEPAMHVDCAEYAAKVCPYMIHGNFVATHPTARDVVGPEEVPPPAMRPDWLGLYVTRSYKIVTDPRAGSLAKAATAKEIRPIG